MELTVYELKNSIYYPLMLLNAFIHLLNQECRDDVQEGAIHRPIKRKM